MRSFAGKRIGNEDRPRATDVCHCSVRATRGFTLVELLVVLAIIAILAALLLVSLAKSQEKVKSAVCLNNLKQLQVGWCMYVLVNNDRLPPNISQLIFPNQANVAGAWVLGNAKTDTNTDNIKAGVLFPYIPNAAVYRCPADTSTVTGGSLIRTRSYSIELWLNADIRNGTVQETVNNNPFNLRKYTQMVDPSPAHTWVFSDEHANTISDGIFVIASPWAFPPDPGGAGPPGPDLHFWSSFPADRHSNGANLSFADGHVEHHTWRFHHTSIPDRKGQHVIKDPEDLADLTWLQQWIPHKPATQ